MFSEPEHQIQLPEFLLVLPNVDKLWFERAPFRDQENFMSFKPGFCKSFSIGTPRHPRGYLPKGASLNIGQDELHFTIEEKRQPAKASGDCLSAAWRPSDAGYTDSQGLRPA